MPFVCSFFRICIGSFSLLEQDLFETNIKKSDILALPKQFPNLQDFVWTDSNDDTDEDEEFDDEESLAEDDNGYFDDFDDFDDSVGFQCSDVDTLKDYERLVNEQNAKHRDRITSFKEEGHFPLAKKILENNGFCNLSNLNLEIGYTDYSSLSIKHLEKASKLKTPHLVNGSMSTLIFDELCSNVQQLETLQLSSICIAGPNENLPAFATLKKLEKLQIVDCEEESNGRMLKRMAGKCPNLKSLNICPNDNILNWDDEEVNLAAIASSCSHLAALASSCPNLKCCDVDFYPIKPEILAAIDASGNDNSSIKGHYKRH
ncbi:hypothetical protein BD408DRAFT_486043 [Parasitella parasitica]|nr:hypothetical protein BD408DRAFT_486043 [Parasitella parasitica]